MKLFIFATFLTVALFSVHCNGQASLSNGTHVEDWAADCNTVIAENDFYGSCCSFSDIDENGNLCRLTIAGQDEGCGWNNIQYMQDCVEAGGCVSGPYIGVVYEPGTPVEECPPSEYDWQTSAPTTDNSTSPPGEVVYDYNVTFVAVEACPRGSITALVKDVKGNPVVGIDIGFLLTGQENTDEYSGSVVTDDDGYATFDFTASNEDAGETLWCSMAVENPLAWLGNQQVPCSITVCDTISTDTQSSSETISHATAHLSSIFRPYYILSLIALPLLVQN